MTPAAYTEANARRLAAAALRRLPGVTCVLSGLWVQAILKDGAEEVNHNGKDEIELRLRPTDFAENFSAIFVKFLVRNTRRRPFFRHLSGERCRLCRILGYCLISWIQRIKLTSRNDAYLHRIPLVRKVHLMTKNEYFYCFFY